MSKNIKKDGQDVSKCVFCHSGSPATTTHAQEYGKGQMFIFLTIHTITTAPNA